MSEHELTGGYSGGHRLPGQMEGADAPADDDRDWPTRAPGWDDAIDVTGVDDPERESTSSTALWEGDEGGLEDDQRRALVSLLRNRFITARTHAKDWRALTRNPRPIQARLNDLFLELRIDPEREVAYKRQVRLDTGSRSFPKLLYDSPWGREDTVLLVYLRTRFRSETAAGASRVFADREDMLDYIEQRRPDRATDRSGDAKRAAKAIDNLVTAGLLIGASTAVRFELSPAIEVLMPMPKLTELLTWLTSQNSPASADTDTRTDTDGGVDTPGSAALDAEETTSSSRMEQQ